MLRALLWPILLMGAGWAVADTAPPRMAMGLIVKLKGADTAVASQSVVRLQTMSRPAATPQEARTRLYGASQRQRVGYLLQKPTAFAAHVIHGGRPVPLAQAEADAARLRQDPDVEWVIVNEMVPPASVDLNDPGYGGQTWLQARDSGHAGVANYPAAWAALSGRTLSPVVVAVLDTGILPAPDLDGRVLGGYDFVSDPAYSGDGDGVDPDPRDEGDRLPTWPAGCVASPSRWHGLSVAAVLAANTGNALGGAGALAPLPGPVVLPVRVAGACGAQLSDILEGMLWAAGISYHGSPARNVHPARVVNLSFGGVGSCADIGSGARDVAWLYRQTIATLKSQGVLVVSSAGNGDKTTGLGLWGATRPANCASVLAVTGLNERGYKARYANLLNTDGVQAFGLAVASGDTDGSPSNFLTDSGIVTQVYDDLRGEFTLAPTAGTSLAAPAAAGVAALMLAVNPGLTVDDLLWGLTQKTSPFPDNDALPACVPGQVTGQGNCNCTIATCGAGVLDAESAVNWAIDRATSGGGGTATPSSTSGSQSVCYFTPSREGGGDACSSPSSAGGDQGGGGGAASLLDLLVLAFIAACVGRAGRQSLNGFKGGRR